MHMRKINNTQLLIDISIESDEWQSHTNTNNLINNAISKTTKHVKIPEYNEISICLTNNNKIQMLNQKYRKSDKPTNVLSFPSSKPHLGDIVISYDYIIDEIEKFKKSFDSHLSHLIVHGFLHLIGMDHDNKINAENMENIEIIILEELGYSNPYDIYY